MLSYLILENTSLFKVLNGYLGERCLKKHGPFLMKMSMRESFLLLTSKNQDVKPKQRFSENHLRTAVSPSTRRLL